MSKSIENCGVVEQYRSEIGLNSGTHYKTDTNAKDKSYNFGHEFSLNFNGIESENPYKENIPHSTRSKLTLPKKERSISYTEYLILGIMLMSLKPGSVDGSEAIGPDPTLPPQPNLDDADVNSEPTPSPTPLRPYSHVEYACSAKSLTKFPCEENPIPLSGTHHYCLKVEKITTHHHDVPINLIQKSIKYITDKVCLNDSYDLNAIKHLYDFISVCTAEDGNYAALSTFNLSKDTYSIQKSKDFSLNCDTASGAISQIIHAFCLTEEDVNLDETCSFFKEDTTANDVKNELEKSLKHILNKSENKYFDEKTSAILKSSFFSSKGVFLLPFHADRTGRHFNPRDIVKFHLIFREGDTQESYYTPLTAGKIGALSQLKENLSHLYRIFFTRKMRHVDPTNQNSGNAVAIKKGKNNKKKRDYFVKRAEQAIDHTSKSLKNAAMLLDAHILITRLKDNTITGQKACEDLKMFSDHGFKLSQLDLSPTYVIINDNVSHMESLRQELQKRVQSEDITQEQFDEVIALHT